MKQIQILCRFWPATNNSGSNSHLYGCGQPKTEQQKALIIETDVVVAVGKGWLANPLFVSAVACSFIVQHTVQSSSYLYLEICLYAWVCLIVATSCYNAHLSSKLTIFAN